MAVLVIYWMNTSSDFQTFFCMLLCCIACSFSLWQIVFLDSLWFSLTVVKSLETEVLLLWCYCLYAQFLSLLLCWICICLFLGSLKVVVFCFVSRRRSAVQLFLYLSILVMFFRCSLCILIFEYICLFFSSLAVCSFVDTL